MNVQTPSKLLWREILKEEMNKPYFKQVSAFVKEERKHFAIYPPEEEVFNALKTTPFDQVKVVILGQDPYHQKGQAHGLCFSVPKGVEPPPSLKNIFKELKEDVGIHPPPHGCLSSWAEQGVLLLNTTLTVRQSSPLSHHKKGWELFTDAIISALAHSQRPLVFVLWGKSAQDKCRFLLPETPRGTKEFFHNNQLILLSPHPSPLSCHQGFFGCRHFSKINNFLIQNQLDPIDWNLK